MAAEINFTAKAQSTDPFNELILDVIFTEPGGTTLRVPAFWDGGDLWKVRYASSTLGVHRYRTECNRKDRFGLDGLNGLVEVVAYKGRNALFAHGPVRIAPDHRHFEHRDGTPFFWLGDTWWMGLCHRIRWPEEFKTLTADRQAKGFNVIQIVAGLYPDMPPFDPRGANEAGFPWETNYARIRPSYFDAADQRLNYLVQSGFTPCLVGAWGYFLPWMGVEKAKQHWRYLIARYGAWPVVWCAAGEANLPYYLVKGFPFESREQVEGWSEVMKYIRQTDPFHRPLSSHPTGLGRLSARGVVTDQSLIDFDMLQTGHGMREVLRPTVKTMRDSYADTPVMPVLNSEVCFEHLSDRIPAEIPRLMFWASMLSGGAGHTYGANGIWQCNRPGQPHGASPHGGNYGNISWIDAMNLPGSRQVGLAKQFLLSFGWKDMEPQPDSVQWTEPNLPEHWGDWIWFPEGDPKVDAPAEARYFRKTFELGQKPKFERARLYLDADDKFEAWVNGQPVGTGSDWATPKAFEIGGLLKSGRNLIAVLAENGKASVKQNPAGLIASLCLVSQAGTTIYLISDSSWRVAKNAARSWNRLGFDDTGWVPAMAIARFGDGPWGKIGGKEDTIVPFAAGSADRLRIVYAPDPRGVQVSNLRAGATYRLTRFDPVSGKYSRPTRVTTDVRGVIRLSAPTIDQDWAAALELSLVRP